MTAVGTDGKSQGKTRSQFASISTTTTAAAVSAAAAIANAVSASGSGGGGDSKSTRPVVAPKLYSKEWKIECADPAVAETLTKSLPQFECVICQEIPWQPQACVSCGKAFCLACIQQWKKTKSVCPACNKRPLKLKTLLEDAVTSLTWNGLKIRCPGYASSGCIWTGDYSTAWTHVEKFCEFHTVTCPYCLVKRCRAEQRTHEQECDEKPIMCSCGKGPYGKTQMGNHIRTVCPTMIRWCEACMTFKGARAALLAHQLVCPEISCKCVVNGCDVYMKRKDAHLHDENTSLAIALRHLKLAREQLEQAKAPIALDDVDAKTLYITEKIGKKRKAKAPVRVSSSDDEDDGKLTQADRDFVVDDDEIDLGEDEESDEDELPCTTEPECPYGGFYLVNKPYGKRCVRCNMRRKAQREVEDKISKSRH